MPTLRWRMNQLFGKLNARNRIQALIRAGTLLDVVSMKPELPPCGPMPETLKACDLDVLRLLSFGMTNAEIASRLALASGTIKWRMSQILRKLQVRNRVEALARAHERQAL